MPLGLIFLMIPRLSQPGLILFSPCLLKRVTCLGSCLDSHVSPIVVGHLGKTPIAEATGVLG